VVINAQTTDCAGSLTRGDSEIVSGKTASDAARTTLSRVVCLFMTTPQLYTPHTNGWTIARGAGAAHAYHVATLLPDGAVLIAGGVVVAANVLSFAEVYDPRTGRWRTTDSM